MSEATGELIAVPFRDDTVWASQRDGDILVAVRPIAERLGLNWPSQFRRLMADEVLVEGVVKMTTPSPGGEQETLCLRADLIPGWLFGVKANKVKPEIRDKIRAYRRECYKALWQHFRGGGGGGSAAGGGSLSAHVHNCIVANLHPHQTRVLDAVAAHGEIDTATMIATTGLSIENVKRSIYLLWYLGVVDAFYDANGIVRYRVMPADKRPYLPFPAGPQRPPRLAGRARSRG